MGKGSIEARIKEILEEPFWLLTLETNKQYSILQDDCDGDLTKGILSVLFTPDGDASIVTEGLGPFEVCRFCTSAGGGHNQRVRTALLILAEAIRLDTEERRR